MMMILKKEWNVYLADVLVEDKGARDTLIFFNPFKLIITGIECINKGQMRA